MSYAQQMMQMLSDATLMVIARDLQLKPRTGDEETFFQAVWVELGKRGAL